MGHGRGSETKNGRRRRLNSDSAEAREAAEVRRVEADAARETMNPDAPKSSPAPTPRQFQLAAVRECAYYDCGPWTDPVERTQAVLGHWKAFLASEPNYDGRVENAGVLFLNDEGQLLGHYSLRRGGESFVSMEPSEFLPMAREAQAAGVIACHSHPDGDPAEPSERDLRAARLLAIHARAYKLRIVDCVSVGDDGACSLAANGLLPDVEAEIGPDAEPADYLDARDSWMLSAALMFRDPELQCLVIDKAHKSGMGCVTDL